MTFQPSAASARARFELTKLLPEPGSAPVTSTVRPFSAVTPALALSSATTTAVRSLRNASSTGTSADAFGISPRIATPRSAEASSGELKRSTNASRT